MFVKRLLQKATHHPQKNVQLDNGMLSTWDLQISVHYGIPYTSSRLAFDPIQGLLAIGTLDGRIKVIGGDNIEGLLISPKNLPFKFLEFLQNKGILVSISNDNDIQVWNLESRSIACFLQWEFNITAFSLIGGSCFMYLGDERGVISVLKHEAEDGRLLQLPYCISANSVAEASGLSFSDHLPIVGVLPQPCSSENRVLIAYQNGLILLWDALEARIVFVKGDKDLNLKDDIDFPTEVDASFLDDTAENHLEDKEISALCWASSDGSILAVGYVDGDIIFWNMFTAASTKGQLSGLSCNVVKLQLSSSKRRLPVVVLHWSKNNRTLNNHDGQLFIYGGDEIGSEEVLTVLSLEWSSGTETLRCVGRVNLTLNGSFADMMLLPSAGATGSTHSAALFVLTNPGQLLFYDNASLSTLMSKQETSHISGMKFPAVIPTADPHMTVVKLSLLQPGGNSSKALSKIASLVKVGARPPLDGSMKWPLTGGVRGQVSFAEDDGVERVFVGGYDNGSVRMWDATHPVLALICVIGSEVDGIELAGSGAPVTKLDFCFFTLNVAVGNNCGLVHLYDLNESSDERGFHFVTENKHEVHSSHQRKGVHCKAAFSILNSPVNSLHFTNSGGKLAVGYECGRVSVLDTSSLTTLFLTDSVSGSSVLSLTWKTFMNTQGRVETSESSELSSPGITEEEFLFVLRKDATISIVNAGMGNIFGCWPLRLKAKSPVISMYVIEGSNSASGLFNEKRPLKSPKGSTDKNEPMKKSIPFEVNSHNSEHNSSEAASSLSILWDSFVLLCCEDCLRLHDTKSIIQGRKRPVRKVKLSKACSWASTFRRDDKDSGLVLLYQNGVIEIRSLFTFQLVKESSLMSTLRWNFKANISKTMISSDSGQILLVNGCEVTFISLAESENDSRILESLPCLFDKVVAAAADTAINVSNQKKKKGSPGILGNVFKGFKGRRAVHTPDITTISSSDFTRLETIFSSSPFADPSQTSTNMREVADLDIDDIEIDDPISVEPTSSYNKRDEGREESDRERLFEGGTADPKPRLRTPEEIMATYRKAGDASSVAAHAREKLVQRQEKLERINRRTEELKSGAEGFATLANELVKTMESRKWWKI